MSKSKRQYLLSLSGLYFALFALLGLALILSAMTWKVLYATSLDINKHIYAAQLNLTQGHLMLEKKLHGADEIAASQVWLNFESAQTSINQLIAILNRFNRVSFVKTTNTHIPINLLLNINKKITQLETKTNKLSRGKRSIKSSTPEYDVQYNQHFTEILADIRFAKHILDKIINHAMERQFRLQLLTLSFWICLLLATVSASIYLEKKRNQVIKKMEYLVYHDQLTDLPNRQQAENLLNQAVASSKQHKHKFALMILDINNFRFINDNFGRKKGDQLLRLIAERLKICLKKDDIIPKIINKSSISRIDGDKFSIILEGINDFHDAGLIYQHLRKDIGSPFLLGNDELNITLSAGISMYPFIKQPSHHLFSFSEAALKKAKHAGRNSSQYYTKELYKEHTSLLLLEHELSLALEYNQFSLVYQPQVSLTHMTVVGAEVLIRWNHPIKGFISPDKFIPVAEHGGQIAAIGKWIIQKSCEQWADWANQGVQLPKLAINLSSTQLNKANLIEDINKIVANSGIMRECIEFEITETSIMQEGIVVNNFLRDLKHAGYRLSIDDFGTGYSSLERLKKLPVELLKIDKSFIDDLAENSEDYFIVKAIISLAHSLNLLVLAEGVETTQQLNILKELNCDIIQGYLFSQPLSSVDFLAFITKKASNPE
jgi:diguanylate cyclase (GGDEF)-like protein